MCNANEMDELNNFDPMTEAYNNYASNSYVSGYGNPNVKAGPGYDVFEHVFSLNNSIYFKAHFQHEAVLFVSSIPRELNEYGLKNVFNKAGTVTKILGFHQPKTASHKVGKVVYATQAEAVNAITIIHMKKPYRMLVQFDRSPEKFCWESWVFGQLETAVNGNRRPSPLLELELSPPFTSVRGSHSLAGRGRSFSVGGDRGRCRGRGDLRNQRPKYTNNTQSDFERKVAREQPAPISPPILKGNCLRCGVVACYKCTRCNGLYCSDDCQRKDWLVHKTTCQMHEKTNEEQSQPIVKPKNNSLPHQPQLAGNMTHRNESPRVKDASDSAPLSYKPNQQQLYYNQKQREPQCYPRSNGFAAKSQQGDLGHDSQTSMSFSPNLKQKCDVAVSQPKGPDRSTAVTQNGTRISVDIVHQQRTQSPSFAKGSKAMVVLSHVDDPSSFYVVLRSKHDELVALGEKVNQASSTATPLGLVSPGQIVAAKFSRDNLFYRAEVKRIRKDGFIELFFMDYGNSESLKQEFLRPLPPDLTSIPGYAMWCCLVNVKPFEDPVGWTTDAKEELCRYFAIPLMATCIDTRGLQLVVILHDENEDGIAKLICTVTKASGKKYSACKVNSTPLARCDSSQEVGGGCDTKCTVSTGHVSQWKVGDVVKLGFLIRDGETSLWMIVTSAFADDIDLLCTLSDQCTLTTTRFHAMEGSIVCALSPTDKSWYRAVVKHVGCDGRFTVQYLDYGNVETVNAVCKLPEPFKQIAALAVQLEFRDPDSCKKVAEGITADGLSVTVLAKDHEKAKVRLFLAIESINMIAFSVWHDKFAASPQVRVAGPIVSVIAEHPVPSGDFRVTVTDIDQPNVVYVTLQDRASQLERLQQALCDEYQKDTIAPLSSLSLPHANQLLCARFSKDNQWYRGRVEGIVSGHEVRIRYVDYGTVETVPLHRMKPLMPQFLTPHSFVLQVQPKITVPVPTDQIAALLLESDATLWNVKVLDGAARPVIVEMSIDGRTLDHILAERYVPNAASPPACPLVPPTCPIVPPTCPIVPPTCPIVPPVHPIVPPVQCESVQLQIGSPVNVMVNAVLPGGVICGVKVDDKVLNQIDELNSRITKRYESEAPPLIKDVKLSVGTLLLAKSTEYEHWFRAWLLDVMDCTKCRVHFADFGNTELIDMANLRTIPPEFCQIPLQCVKFTLEGVVCDTMHAVNLLGELLLLKNVNVNIIGFVSEKYTIRIPRLEPELIKLGLMQS